MESQPEHLKTLKTLTRILIYASISLGVLLLVQLYSVVPSWLFYSVLAGWIAYLVTGVAIARGLKTAYPISLILAVLTLIVSLPQPEHSSLVRAGLSLASLTFIVGSALQIAVILSVSIYLFQTRRLSGSRATQNPKKNRLSAHAESSPVETVGPRLLFASHDHETIGMNEER